MTEKASPLPQEFADDIAQHSLDVTRFLDGELSASILKSRRVPRGIYEQRQDGSFMVRVRLPGGLMAVNQIKKTADLAEHYGSGMLHVTTRQDIQIHNVKIEQTPAIIKELFLAGLTSRGGGGNTVRNVTSCPYAGICPAERFDVTPCVVAVTDYLIRLPGSYNLPRKYKIAFSGCSADCALAQISDLGFIAHVRNGQPGFSVYAGGGMGAESRIGDRMDEWIPAADTIRIAEAVRRLFDLVGDRRNRRQARLRFAVKKMGADAFRDMLRETVKKVTDENIPALEPLPHPVESPVDAPGGYRSLLTQVAGAGVLYQRQKGYAAVPVRLPFGNISSKSLGALADVAERFSEEKMLRATQDQNLLLRFVRQSEIGKLCDEVSRILGPNSVLSSAGVSITACTGAAICRLGLCLSQPAAKACADALTAADLEPSTLLAVDIRINGCPNACGQHPVGTIGLFGATQRSEERLVPAYRILLGSRRGEGRARLGESAGAVPARALPALLKDLLLDFQNQRKPEEPFADYFDRKGMSHFQRLIAEHAKVPHYADDPSFYRDWGRDEDFTLAGRGAGECGAGVFEVIAEDLSVAARALAQAEKTAIPHELLLQGLLATIRALLITRGIDSQNPDVIFASFEQHFLDSGLVDSRFRDLLARARSCREGKHTALDSQAGEIRELLHRIEELYSTMDAELRFRVPEQQAASPQAPAAESSAAAVEIDLRGVACPMNFVKAKLRLETMSIGSTLGVLLDDGAPIQNVPASFKNEGQEVLEIHAVDGGHWHMLIRKKK
ncbi:MAG: sulfurtransferase TusA family protein [Kiritimatiellia bacterium]